MSEKLHVFSFEWGYVETSRIAQLPKLVHRIGFDTPLEAAASFKRNLRQLSDSRGCPDHGVHHGSFCSICAKPTRLIEGTEEQAYDTFDNFYQQEVDGCPCRDLCDEWDDDWMWEWEANQEFLETAKATQIYRFDQYLEDDDEVPCGEWRR